MLASYFSSKTIEANMSPIIIVFQREIPITCLKTALVTILWSILIGGPVVTVLIGGSVERAMAAKVSMIKLI